MEKRIALLMLVLSFAQQQSFLHCMSYKDSNYIINIEEDVSISEEEAQKILKETHGYAVLPGFSAVDILSFVDVIPNLREDAVELAEFGLVLINDREAFCRDIGWLEQENHNSRAAVDSTEEKKNVEFDNFNQISLWVESCNNDFSGNNLSTIMDSILRSNVVDNMTVNQKMNLLYELIQFLIKYSDYAITALEINYDRSALEDDKIRSMLLEALENVEKNQKSLCLSDLLDLLWHHCFDVAFRIIPIDYAQTCIGKSSGHNILLIVRIVHDALHSLALQLAPDAAKNFVQVLAISESEYFRGKNQRGMGLEDVMNDLNKWKEEFMNIFQEYRAILLSLAL